VRVLASGLVLLALVGCAPTAPIAESPKALTSEQSERLAVTRFRNFDAGVRTVDATFPAASGDVELTGLFDFATGVGYASVTVDDVASGLVWWTHETIAVRSAAVDGLPLPLPEDGWESGALDPSSTTLANSVALIASLGSDRPENPQLLAQSDAAWLRADSVGEALVDVFAGPSADSVATASSDLSARAVYWVDATGILLRFESPLTPAPAQLTVDFGTADATELPTTVPGTP
jgi:hypothetical protein